MSKNEYQTSIEDFIVPPSPENPAEDLFFSAIRDGMPGTRALLLEDYKINREDEIRFYLAVRKRLEKVDFTGPNGERIYTAMGGIKITRPGREDQHFPWWVIIEDIKARIHAKRWIGSMEEKAENAAARKLKEAAGKSPWNLGGYDEKKDEENHRSDA